MPPATVRMSDSGGEMRAEGRAQLRPDAESAGSYMSMTSVNEPLIATFSEVASVVVLGVGVRIPSLTPLKSQVSALTCDHAGLR